LLKNLSPRSGRRLELSKAKRKACLIQRSHKMSNMSNMSKLIVFNL
jgi:hypothetical protein